MRRAVVLDNIRSAYNVGAIFRTADGAGVSVVCLVGVTPLPLDRFGRTQQEIAKTSLGASEFVTWKYFPDADACIHWLSEERYVVVAVEQTKQALVYSDFVQSVDTAYVFGNEIEGVSDIFIRSAIAALHIPLCGKKESLNVSVACGIILFNTQPLRRPG